MRHRRSGTGPRPAAVAGLCAAVAIAAAPATAQSVMDRPPSVSGGWVADAGVLQFNFLHRFHQSGPPQRKVTSAPSFVLGAGLPWRTMLAVTYATNSDVVSRLPNEWEFAGRIAPLTEAAGAPIDLAGEMGYNLGARSLDGAVSVARSVGPVRLIGTARGFSNAFDAGETRVALAGGASVRLRQSVALAGDVGSFLDARAEERVAWSAGMQLRIPYTPHTLSLHATNVNTTTLQGTSLGTERVRYGFEFTIPVTLRRYLPRSTSDPPAVARADTTAAAAGASGDSVRIAIEDLAYETTTIEVPIGTTVVWVNEDPVEHTVTADDESFDSGTLDPGESWGRTFSEAGDHPYYCIPHPFMEASIVVIDPEAER